MCIIPFNKQSCGDFQAASGFLHNFAASNKNKSTTSNFSVHESEDQRATG
jgi:hypothetical protein